MTCYFFKIILMTESLQNVKSFSKFEVIGKWIKGLICGSISATTCACCCGCCGKLKAPAVLYDEDETGDQFYQNMSSDDKHIFNTVQWCGLCGLTIKTITTCGVCCGCCGLITPSQAVECISKKKSK